MKAFNNFLSAFPAIESKGARVLILGSMPSVASLEKGQYYGHPRNQFWGIVCTLLETPYSEDYEARKQLLIQHEIALWDVLKACRREGSADSAIRDGVPNDLGMFFNAHPEVSVILFNGQKARQLFQRHMRQDLNWLGLALVTLPSTSPANAAAFEQKLRIWREAFVKYGVISY